MMSRYKRRSKVLRFRFQSFVDLATSASSMQVIQWSVGGEEVINRCRHLFGAYKYFKLGKISVKLVPASTLPVDPLGLSYSDTDPQTVDPRDQMNPGLVRITNGEDIFTDVSSLTADQQKAVYNAMMVDPRWSKFMLQSGFRRSAYPLYWQVGQLSQDKFPGYVTNVPHDTVRDVVGSVTDGVQPSYLVGVGDSRPTENNGIVGNSSPRGLFQVGHKGRLSWLPTDYYQGVFDGESVKTVYGINNVPEVSVITCVLPKAFKTLFFYRCFITEEVLFTGLRSAPISAPGQLSNYQYQYTGLDNFIIASPERYLPGSGPMEVTQAPNQTPINNDGSDLP